MIRRIQFIGLAVVFLLWGGWLLSPTAHAATFIVTGTGDAGDRNAGDGLCDYSANPGLQCTLRAAIEEANALGGTTMHHITFGISGTGPFTITPNSPLPAITVPLGIYGNQQPDTLCPNGDAPADLQIILDGSHAGAGANGLHLTTGSDGTYVSGLVIGNFDKDGVRIISDNNNVDCNYIGVNADGVSPMGNGEFGIYVGGDGNVIAGQALRNVISGNVSGIYVMGDNNVISNNYIGTTADGMSSLGYQTSGVYLYGNNNSVGGNTTRARNVISGNNYGININGGDNNVILGNYIGVAQDGVTPLPNSWSGIKVNGEAIDNVIGGIVFGEANLIAHNEDSGIALTVSNSGGIPSQNEIRGNLIYDNGDLGIDLGGDGVTPNDYRDLDGDENAHQNYPVLLPETSSSVLIAGYLRSLPIVAQYSVDLYRNDRCDPSGNGEGQEYLTTVVITTNHTGYAYFEVDVSFMPVAPGDSITATATDANGNTSEFAACMAVPQPTTPTPTSTPTATHTSTPGPSPTPTNAFTPGPSPTPTNTATPGPSPTPTNTPTPGPSPTPAPTQDPSQPEYSLYLSVILR